LNQLAQTHLQLLRQARDAGYGRSEIYDLRRDYETAVRLHGHLARYNGRPFVCHLVGTASVVLIENQSFPLVRAALNHAAYAVGRFPSGARGKRSDHQRWLASRLGEEVEGLISDITDFPEIDDVFTGKSKLSLETVSERVRDILVQEVANEVDDGHCHGAAIEIGAKWRTDGYVDFLSGLARRFDLDFCLQSLEDIRAELADSDWLTPDTHFTFTFHRQSLPRYVKNTFVAFGKKLVGKSYHY
jgi:hypothetical protein